MSRAETPWPNPPRAIAGRASTGDSTPIFLESSATLSAPTSMINRAKTALIEKTVASCSVVTPRPPPPEELFTTQFLPGNFITAGPDR